MSLDYDIDVGYGIRVKKREAEEHRPAGHIVEIHFYDKDKAVKYALHLIRLAQREAETR